MHFGSDYGFSSASIEQIRFQDEFCQFVILFGSVCHTKDDSCYAILWTKISLTHSCRANLLNRRVTYFFASVAEMIPYRDKLKNALDPAIHREIEFNSTSDDYKGTCSANHLTLKVCAE